MAHLYDPIKDHRKSKSEWGHMSQTNITMLSTIFQKQANTDSNSSHDRRDFKHESTWMRVEPETKTQVNNVLEATPDGNIPSLHKKIPNNFTPTLTFKNLHRAAESSAPTDPLKSWVWCRWRGHWATVWFIWKPPSDCPSVFAISDWCALDAGAGSGAACL